MKQFILHIGMGKCGSSSIQAWLSSIRYTSILNITYPGEIDANAIIEPYITEPRRLPDSVINSIDKGPTGIEFSNYAIKVAKESDAEYVVLSSEHISWLLDDEATDKLAQELLLPISVYRHITVIAYFRYPESSRYLSTLQEDAKYNSEIRLFVPNWPYSENNVVYSRWSKLCRSNDFRWIPVAFNRKILIGGDVINDFIDRVKLPVGLRPRASVAVNKSVDPVLLCAYRNIAGDCLDLLPWDRKAEMLNKIQKAWNSLKSDFQLIGDTPWILKPSLDDYISDVSKLDETYTFVNSTSINCLSAALPTDPWDPERIKRIIPFGLVYRDGYLTGNLHMFLEGIDMEQVQACEIALKKDILTWYSTYYGEV